MQFDEVLQFAISMEIDAAKTYEQLCEHCDRESTKAVFQELIAMENDHAQRLRAIVESGEVCFPKQEDSPSFDESILARVKKPKGASTVIETLEFAIKAEKKAYDLYRYIGQFECSNKARSLFSALAEEELRHQYILEKEYADIKKEK